MEWVNPLFMWSLSSFKLYQGASATPAGVGMAPVSMPAPMSCVLHYASMVLRHTHQEDKAGGGTLALTTLSLVRWSGIKSLLLLEC